MEPPNIKIKYRSVPLENIAQSSRDIISSIKSFDYINNLFQFEFYQKLYKDSDNIYKESTQEIFFTTKRGPKVVLGLSSIKGVILDKKYSKKEKVLFPIGDLGRLVISREYHDLIQTDLVKQLKVIISREHITDEQLDDRIHILQHILSSPSNLLSSVHNQSNFNSNNNNIQVISTNNTSTSTNSNIINNFTNNNNNVNNSNNNIKKKENITILC